MNVNIFSVEKPSAPGGAIDLQFTGGPLTQITNVLCTGMVDDRGNGSGRCVISGEFEGQGTWAGRIDVEARSLVLDIHLQVVCPRCAPR